MPPLHEIMNIIADSGDGGLYPPMPSIDTLIGPEAHWLDHGRYHFAKDTKPFVGFEFDYGGHEMNRWWRMRKPGQQYVGGYGGGYYVPNGWDYAGYTMGEQLWDGPDSPEAKFRNALTKLAGLIPDSMSGTVGSSSFRGTSLLDLIKDLSALAKMLDTHSEKMRKAYQELDVPEGPMMGSAASAYAARLFDFSRRLLDLKNQVNDNHKQLEPILEPIKAKALELQTAVTEVFNDPGSGMRRILDDWYHGMSAGSEQWNSARNQFQVLIHQDPPVYGIPGDPPTNSNINNELKNRWRRKHSRIIEAADALYDKMDELYKRAYTNLEEIETPKGGLPMSMVGPGDNDGPGGGDGNGNGGPETIKIDWGDGPPEIKPPPELNYDTGGGGDGNGPPEVEPPPELNFDTGGGDGNGAGGGGDGTGGGGDGGPDLNFDTGGGGDGSGSGEGGGSGGPDGTTGAPPPPPGMSTNFPGTGDGTSVPPPVGGGNGGAVPPPPPPLSTNFPGTGDGATAPPPGADTDFPGTGGGNGGVIPPPPPPLSTNFPGSGGSGGSGGDRRPGGAPPVLDIDPETGLPIDPGTGRPYPVDPDTGIPYNPDNGLPINFDPGTGEVAPIDPVTGEPVSPGGGTRLDMDPETGLPIDPGTGRPYPVDPETGLPYNPDTGLPINYDPVTGQVDPIDPVTGRPLPPDSFSPPPVDPGMDTNFPGGSENTPINPVTGGPAEVDPDTGIPYPVDPDTGEAIKDGFDVPEDLTYPPPRFESGGPEGLNYGGSGGNDPSSGGSGGSGAPGSVDRSDMFATPTQAGGGVQAQAGAGGGAGAGAAGPGGAVGAAGADGTGGMGSPMMPPMMPPMGGMGGGGGGGENRDRNRSTWLSEDEKVWGTDKNRQRSVLGRPEPGGKKKGAARHEFVDAGADGGRTGTASHDDEGTLGRKRKPGVGNRRGRRQEQAGGGDGGRDGSAD
ncbi:MULTISPECIES: hypothetical protein [unclassified Nocardiopsis]|uniref:hypothetical protein n=1 Tax=Nocardiopsis TaxID=2013 RepID=UPI00387AB71F